MKYLKKGAVKVICETQECKKMEADLREPLQANPFMIMAPLVVAFIIFNTIRKWRK